jgi:hypothetical protein
MAHWAEILDKGCERYKQNISSRDEVRKVYWETNGVKNWKQTMPLGKIGKEKQGKKSLSNYGHVLHMDASSFSLRKSKAEMSSKQPLKRQMRNCLWGDAE